MSILVWVDHELNPLDDTLNLLALPNGIENLLKDLVDYSLATSSDSNYDVNKSVLDLLLINVYCLCLWLNNSLYNLLHEMHTRILLLHRLCWYFSMLELFMCLAEHLFLCPRNPFPFSSLLGRYLPLTPIDFLPTAFSAPLLTLLGSETGVPDMPSSAFDLNNCLSGLILCLYNSGLSSVVGSSSFNCMDNLDTIVAYYMTLDNLDFPESHMTAFTLVLDTNLLLAGLDFSPSWHSHWSNNLFLRRCFEFSIAELHNFWVRHCTLRISSSCPGLICLCAPVPLNLGWVTDEVWIFHEDLFEYCVHDGLVWFWMLGCTFRLLLMIWIIADLPIDPVLPCHLWLNLRNCLAVLLALCTLLANSLVMVLLDEGPLVVGL